MTNVTQLVGTDGITAGNSMTKINNNFTNLNTDKIETSVIDTDTALTANSDAKIPTQKAVKAYVDAGGNVNASTTTRGIVEEATVDEVQAGTATGGTGARLFVGASTIPSRVYNFASSGTWTKPSSGTFAFIEIWGGGGSGGVAMGPYAHSTGGSGGEFRSALIPLAILGDTETVTIGTGGTAVTVVANGATSGGTGNDSTFGSWMTAKAGVGGSANVSDSNTQAAVAGGTGGTSSGLAVQNENGGSSGSASTTSTGSASNAPNTTSSGAGGGGVADDNGNVSVGTPGTSTHGGNGGAYAGGIYSGTVTATSGGAKGGGGGAATLRSSGSATSGAGGGGYCRVTVF